MADLFEKISSADNIYWAWNKVKNMFGLDDTWVDCRELARFECNLKEELRSIAEDIKKNKYKVTPIRPIIYPKKNKHNKENNKNELRQWFYIAIRDQVAWMAYTNVVGTFLDPKMPSWVYSYRLHRPRWCEDGKDGKKNWKAGWYYHSTGRLYNKFSQGWPRYRRNIYFTVPRIVGGKGCGNIPLSENDQNVEDMETQIDCKEMRLKYLDHNYWDNGHDEAYWASIDLKKFYPNIPLKVIGNNIENFLCDKWSKDLKFLTHSLLTFPLDCDGFRDDELRTIGIRASSKKFLGLPTGLLTAGFLSNVAMMDIDNIVESESKNNQIAHFRYVDDHVFLSPNFDNLTSWIRRYKDLIKKHLPSVDFNNDKIEPDAFREYFRLCVLRGKDHSKRKNAALTETKVDLKFPAPLMTKTLALVSAINDVEFELLDEKEQEQLLNNLEHLLLVDFPDDELRVDTRISFAASKIARLAPIRFPHYNSTELYDIEHQLGQKREKKLALEKEVSECGVDNKIKLQQQIKNLQEDIDCLSEKGKNLAEEKEKKENNEKRRTYSLLLRTLEKYPEKLKIWVRVLEFCRNIGFVDFKELFDKLDFLKKECKESYLFYRSFFLENISRQIFFCLKNILDDSIILEQRRAYCKFITGCLSSNDLHKLYDDLRLEVSPKYYETVSRQMLECALGVVMIVVDGNHLCDDVLDAEKCYECKRHIDQKYSYLPFKDSIKWLKDNPEYGLAVWAWLADKQISFPVQNEPSILWKQVANQLNLDEKLSWVFLKKYPLDLSAIDRVFDYMKVGTLSPGQHEDGVYFEYMHNLTEEKRNILLAKQPFLRKIFSGKKYNNYICLYEWIDFLNGLREKNKNNFDPRLGEWTALQIVYQIYQDCFRSMSLRQLCSFKPSISLANYLLPKAWEDYADGELSWHIWRDRTKCKAKANRYKIIKRRQHLLCDDRYTLNFIDKIGKDCGDVQIAIRGLAMLLLVLILRDYRLPGVWNPSGHSREWETLFKQLLHDAECSSHTASILEACLMPRVRENAENRGWQCGVYGDKTPDNFSNDPEPILSLDDFGEKIKAAMKELESNQISINGDAPRQLTLVTINALQRGSVFGEQQEVLGE